jgi:hypothetical protein
MRGLLAITVVLSFSATTPAFANWWVVRSSDETCLVVDIEPTGKEKGITKIGKDSYPTAEQAELVALGKAPATRMEFLSPANTVRSIKFFLMEVTCAWVTELPSVRYARHC